MTAKWTDFVAGSVLTAAQLNDVVDNFQDIAVFNESQASGTSGGTPSTGSFLKRTLNTTVVNNISGCSIASSVITLPAGTYYVMASSTFYESNNTKIKLRNTTDSTDTIIGQNAYIGTGIGSSAYIQGMFTIAASKNFEVQYRLTNASGAAGLGLSAGFGVSEVYTMIGITRVA